MCLLMLLLFMRKQCRPWHIGLHTTSFEWHWHKYSWWSCIKHDDDDRNHSYYAAACPWSFHYLLLVSLIYNLLTSLDVKDHSGKLKFNWRCCHADTIKRGSDTKGNFFDLNGQPNKKHIQDVTLNIK